MVRRVMDRLIMASGLEHVAWEVHVIDSPGKYPIYINPFLMYFYVEREL